ncbi:MAG: hypothetical protein ABIQ33_02195 [Caldimonas sp.]
MAMKLFAHTLRGEHLGTENGPRASRQIDPRRWVFHDLVVRRAGFAPWGMSNAAPADGPATIRRDDATEPLWHDTQPWCHE